MNNRLTVILLLILWGALSVSAQQGNRNELDSIKFDKNIINYNYKVGLSYLASDSADYVKGRKILQDILPYTDGNLRYKTLKYIAYSWYKEYFTYFSQFQFEQTFDCLLNAAEIYHQISDFRNESECWLTLGTSKYYIKDFDGADYAYKKALQLSKENNDHRNHMQALIQLSKLCSSTNNYKELLRHNASMDSLANSGCPEKVLISYCYHKGDEALNRGEYTLSELWYDKAYKLGASIDSKLHTEDYYGKMRNLYVAKKEYNKALFYENGIINILSSHKDSKLYYLEFISKYKIYKNMGDSIEAQKCLDTLLLAKSYLTEPRQINILYKHRAMFYALHKNYHLALKICQEGDSILSTKYDGMDEDRIEYLLHKACYYYYLKNYPESELCIKEYLRRIELIYGDASIEYFDALSYVANILGSAGNIKEGCNYYNICIDVLKRILRENLPYLNSEERESFWNPFSQTLMEMTPFAIASKQLQNDFTRSSYDALVLAKAFLLETERGIYDVLKEHGSKEDIDIYISLSALKSRILYLQKDYMRNSDTLIILNEKKKELEHLLLEKCKKDGDLTHSMNVDYSTVKQNLTSNQILIGFTDWYDKSQGRKYAAYIINKRQSSPLLVPLFAEKDIDSLNIPRPDMYYEEPYAKDVVNMIWKPLSEHVSEGATIFYVPSQILYQIALESLPLSDGSLLGEHYNFVRLSSAREIGKVKGNITFSINKKTAVLYGGLKYDVTATEMLNESLQYKVSSLFTMRGGKERGDSLYRELADSKKEVESIQGIMKQQNMYVQTYTGIKGTEESFLNMNGNAPGILHLATHGFYYTPEQAEKIDYLHGYKEAMSLSGLVMSGGNAAWRGIELPHGVLGGILTAEKISRMDLTGTELVVLSACQTGQGEATSEGLYGLQRAFKKAGAQSLILSLWNVSDVVSREFMVTFYKQLTNPQNLWNKHNAFNAAKKYIRKKYPEPYYWSAFVIVD